ncbi:hypothetical protein [Rhodoferax sp.]|nr:hypothetical protein [Rhodoferax sp.]MDR3368997.1 hypothetical protein [Rhodoferax sp.]
MQLRNGKVRNVVVLRRCIKRNVVLTHRGKDEQQLVLNLGWDEVQKDAQL